MSLHLAKPEHEVAYQDICALIDKHATNAMTGVELLAVAANMLGKLIALQDQRTMTRERALEIVMKNLEHGNQQVLLELSQSRGRG